MRSTTPRRRHLRPDLRRGPGEIARAARLGHQRRARQARPGDPARCSDVFFRIGGPHAGRATTSLLVDQRRHDPRRHLGVARRPRQRRRLDVNTADTGVDVNGDNVTATGLFVEHYQKYNVIWAGENGKTIMFQNEMPYDPPNQAAFQHDGILGWAAYKVADDVQDARGLGSRQLLLLQRRPDDPRRHAFEVPVTPGVRLHDISASRSRGTDDRPRRERHGAPTPRQHDAGRHRLVPVTP